MMPQLAKFDQALDAAIPNLVVAQPWLSELMKPLQASLHKIVDGASGWQGAVAEAAQATEAGDRGAGSRSRTPSNSTNTPQQPRAAGGADGGGSEMATEVHHLSRQGDAPGGGLAGRTGGKLTPGQLSATSGGGGVRSAGRLSAVSSVQTLDLDGYTPLSQSQSAASLPLTPGMPMRPLPLGLPDANRFAKAGPSSLKTAAASRPLQHALLGRPSPLSKLAPNSFLPGGAREQLLAGGGSFGEQHFVHASRVSHVAEA